MCYLNITIHNGCGHRAPSVSDPYTLCNEALVRLAEATGNIADSMPPPPPPRPKRTSTSISGRFTSLKALGRTSSTSSTISKRSVSDSVTSPISSSFAWKASPSSAIAARCETPEVRERVNSGMDVCEECRRWVEEMRFLVKRYDQSGSVKGCKAFDEFLRDRENGHRYY
ncbi:hypothetical protein BU16DRAFT_525815 [Lophium mytilinum]|uniref:Uncharacterized protein n=1 Tax=Lophium mytilinum TaxID=390894 RepID=A0A6A6QWY1_9PEZI|nr:hypothetical protein BU16DRAFT_525815 [Lophium mytilinum]